MKALQITEYGGPLQVQEARQFWSQTARIFRVNSRHSIFVRTCSQSVVLASTRLSTWER